MGELDGKALYNNPMRSKDSEDVNESVDDATADIERTNDVDFDSSPNLIRYEVENSCSMKVEEDPPVIKETFEDTDKVKARETTN